MSHVRGFTVATDKVGRNKHTDVQLKVQRQRTIAVQIFDK